MSLLGLVEPEEEGLPSFETSETPRRRTQCHILADLNLQQHRSETLKSRLGQNYCIWNATG